MKPCATRWPVLACLVLFSTRLFAGDERIDVSKIIDPATAEAVLGDHVKNATPRNLDGTDGYYSKCNYYSADSRKSLVLRVYQAASGFDPQKDLDQVAENTGAMRAISGLGEKARMSSGNQGGLPNNVVMLYVTKGNTLITIGLRGLEDEAAASDKAKMVAQKILAHL